MPHSFFHKDVHRDSVHSGMWQETFITDKVVPQFNVQTNFDGTASQLRLDLFGNNGIGILKGFPINRGQARFQCGRDLPAGVYTVRLQENNVLGSYMIEIGARFGITCWQKFLILLIGLFVASGAIYFWQNHRNITGGRTPILANSRRVLLVASLPLSVLFLYLLFHEGGHALASICFGFFDLSRSDFFGLYGSPHSGIKAGIQLSEWQKAIQAIAGPLLPSLAAYILFAFWRSEWGVQIRRTKSLVDLFSSFCLSALLFAHVGLVLAILRLNHDSDYSGFVDNFPAARWQADAFLLLILLVNGFLLWHVIPHLLKLRRIVSEGSLRQTEEKDKTEA